MHVVVVVVCVCVCVFVVYIYCKYVTVNFINFCLFIVIIMLLECITF